MLSISPHSATAFCRSLGTVLLSSLTLAGCAALDGPSTDAAPAPAAEMGSQLRKPTPPGQILGLDERAREIERNLGVR